MSFLQATLRKAMATMAATVTLWISHDSRAHVALSGDLVELCPLHEVPARLRAISAVLQRITVFSSWVHGEFEG